MNAGAPTDGRFERAHRIRFVALDVRGADGPRVQVRKLIVCTDLDTHRGQPWAADVRAAIEIFRSGAAAPVPLPAA